MCLQLGFHTDTACIYRYPYQPPFKICINDIDTHKKISR